MELLEQCRIWHENDEYQKIIDTLEAIPEGERTPEQDLELARAEARRLQDQFLRGCVGSVQQVMFEQGGTGYAPNYAPVRTTAAVTPGQVLDIRITGVDGGCLIGEPAN